MEGVFIRRDLFTINSLKIIKQADMLTIVCKIFKLYFNAEVQPPARQFLSCQLPNPVCPDAILFALFGISPTSAPKLIIYHKKPPNC